MTDEEFEEKMGSIRRKYRTITGLDPRGGAYLKNIIAVSTRVRVPTTTFQDNQYNAIHSWCDENFGDCWIHNFTDYYFKNPEHAVMFTLRWV